MLKKTIKFTDFDGVVREEDFYFNLTEAEVVEMQLVTKGGLKQYLESIITAKDVPALAELFKKFINKSYGVKSLDGRKFMKSPEILEEFVSTQAYSNLYMSLVMDSTAASNFINGIFPKSMTEDLKAIPNAAQ